MDKSLLYNSKVIIIFYCIIMFFTSCLFPINTNSYDDYRLQNDYLISVIDKNTEIVNEMKKRNIAKYYYSNLVLEEYQNIKDKILSKLNKLGNNEPVDFADEVQTIYDYTGFFSSEEQLAIRDILNINNSNSKQQYVNRILTVLSTTSYKIMQRNFENDYRFNKAYPIVLMDKNVYNLGENLNAKERKFNNL